MADEKAKVPPSPETDTAKESGMQSLADMVKAEKAAQEKQTDIPVQESPAPAKAEEIQNAAKQPEKSAPSDSPIKETEKQKTEKNKETAGDKAAPKKEQTIPGKTVAQKEDAGSDKGIPKKENAVAEKVSPKENKAEQDKTIPKEGKVEPGKAAPKKDKAEPSKATPKENETEPDKAAPEKDKAAPDKAALKEDKTVPNKATSKEDKAAPKKEKEPSGKAAPQKEAAKKTSPEKKTEKVPPAGKAEKSAKSPEPPKAAPGAGGPAAQTNPPAQPAPTQPQEAPRRGDEQIVYLKLSELHAFKNHPFQVRNDEEMKAMVSSVKDKGVTQPAIVRPREDGGYEIVSGHRRQKASELAGYADMPCIIRNLTDEQAITQMVEDNTNQRENILPSERAKALKMQLEAIKHQGAKNFTSGQLDPKDAGRRSNEVVAERNKMTVKQVQRYIKLNDLVPDLQKMMDEGRIKFTPAVELAYIKPRNQNYIAVAIDSQQSSPSLSQAQRMRELDQKGVLNGDVIDGIMMEDKKEVDKVILTGAELGKYFGKEATPREMKDQIIKLLDDWKGQQKDMAKPEKKAAQPEK